jgi:hypothetical protein
MRTAAYGLLGAVLLCALVLFLLRRNPVLLSLGEDVRSDHGYQVLNPFRSRQPERPAVALLKRLKAGECAIALGRIDPDQHRVASICEKEHDSPITGWHLQAVGLDRGRTILRFGVRRVSAGRRFTDPFWFWVAPRSADAWEVTGYEPWY